MGRFFGWFLLIILVLSLVLGVFLTQPINRDQGLLDDYPRAGEKSILQLKDNSHAVTGKLNASWSRSNLMPSFITPMAGYKVRPAYQDVHDSLYVHCLLLEIENVRVAFLSYDMLIVPPLVSQQVEKNKKSWGVDFVYFSASHTHSGIGGWDDTYGGQQVAGEYNEDIVIRIVQATEKALQKAKKDLKPTELSLLKSDGYNFSKNRLGEQYPHDGRLSSLYIERSDSSKAILTSYSAHATNIYSKGLSISNDYPGQLNNTLEKEVVDFAMYMAGAVGSHSVDHPEDTISDRFQFVEDYAASLLSVIEKKTDTVHLGNPIHLSYGKLPLNMDRTQLRISDNLRLRPGAFQKLFAPLDVDIKYIQINNLVMLGMPCDFSGEIMVENKLYKYAEEQGKELMITSFNGGYLGYITADHHYEKTRRSEIRAMNWVGPYHGEYFTKLIKELVD